MIEENSGKFFRFKLDFDIGLGFAEAYDFTDIHSADGIMVFVYNRVDKEIKKTYKLEEITSSGIALGPIRVFSYPNSRGIDAWKFIMKHNNFILEEPNITKSAQDLNPCVYNWNTAKRWHKSDWDPMAEPKYVPYSEVRSLETRILNSTSGVVTKFTMKKLIDEAKSAFDNLSPSSQKEIVRYISQLKTEPGIDRNVEKAIAFLLGKGRFVGREKVK